MSVLTEDICNYGITKKVTFEGASSNSTYLYSVNLIVDEMYLQWNISQYLVCYKRNETDSWNWIICQTCIAVCTTPLIKLTRGNRQLKSLLMIGPFMSACQAR